jgi:hypothetical protein
MKPGAGEAKSWPEPYIAAVSLCYDGTLPDHLEYAVPSLASSVLRGSFYAYPPNLVEDIRGWRRVADYGHEIANHFLYGAVDIDGLAPHWPRDTYLAEIAEADDLIIQISGCTSTSLALPCVRTSTAKSGMPAVTEMIRSTIVNVNKEALQPYFGGFQTVRSPIDGFNSLQNIDLHDLRCYCVDCLDAEALCVLTHTGISEGAWTILVFNGLRDSVFNTIVHERFCRWLASQSESVLVAPVSEVAAVLMAEPASSVPS